MAYMGDIFIVLMLVLLVTGLLWKFSMLRLNGASRSFYSVVREWEQALGVTDRYETPWFLMLGEDEQSEVLLRSWGLTCTTQHAWFGRWWYGPDGAILVVPRALFVHTESASVPLKIWRQLLKLLSQTRPNRPLDGVIWLCEVEQLTADKDSADAGLAARRKFIDLQQRLGLSLPVYMVLGGFESLPGVSDLLDVLPPTAQNAPLGWASPYPLQASWHPNWINQALGLVQQNLAQLLVEISAIRGHMRPDLYLLPHQLQRLVDPLQSLCDPVFQDNTLGEAPRLRGIYFSATSKVAAPPSDADPFAEDTPPTSAPPLFTKLLWRQRIIAEQGLAQPIKRILQLRQRWQRVLVVGAGIFGLVWLLTMIWAWHTRSEEAERIAELMRNDQTPLQLTPDSDIAPQQVSNFWHLLKAAPSWHLGSFVLPGSWYSSLDQQLAQELRQRARIQLFSPIKNRLNSDLKSLLTPPPQQANRIGGRASDEAYRQAGKLLDQIQALEGYNQRFTGSLRNTQRPLDDAITLANDLFGLSLEPKNLAWANEYNQMLSSADLALATPLDLEPLKAQIATRYLDAMRLWVDTLFANSDFGNVAGTLNAELRTLQSGQSNSLGELEAVDIAIDQLRQLIALTNAAWSQSTGVELTPGYQAELERARQNTLIGPATVEQIQHYIENTKRAFHDRWLERGEDQQGILRQQSGGSLGLQDNLEKLEQGIEGLLRQDFSQAVLSRGEALPNSGEGLRNLSSTKLDAALHYYDNYTTYLQQDVAELPPAYRKAIIGAARSASAGAMWQSLTANTTDGLATAASLDAPRSTFNLPADKALQVLQIFSDIGDSRQTNWLRQELNTRALNDLHRATADIDNLPLFRQPLDFSQWDGNRNLALRYFRESDVQALKLTFSQQFTLITDILNTARPAINWLNVQRDHLSASDSEPLNGFVAMSLELNKYNEQNPASSPMLYQQLVTRDFNDMDLGNCAKTLESALLPEDRGNLAVLARTSYAQARQRCDELQGHAAATAWQRLGGYFQTYLAGRFPFSHDASAVDANPDRVSEFLDLIDNNLPSALSGVQNNGSPGAVDARQFLLKLQNARLWLGPLLIRDKEGLRGLDVEVRWRTDREEERGADQVIDWSLAVGQRVFNYPEQSISRVTWTVGEPVSLTLLWAKGSSQRPLDDSSQPALAVEDLRASWSYQGPWALLRLIHANQASNYFTSFDDTDRPLALQLPLRSLARTDSNALMFIRLSLKTVGGKLALSPSALPVSVPASPYGYNAPLPVASTEIAQ